MSGTPKSVREYMAKIGRRGGAAKGTKKRRTRKQAQAAARARWDKHK